MSCITVFIAAGLLPPMPDRSPIMDDLETIIANMTEKRREDVLTIAKALVELDENSKDKR